MSGLDEVLERLVNEPAFRGQLTQDPVRTLSGYELDADDIEVLAARVTADPGEAGSVEARQSKSALVGLLTQVFDAGGNLGGHRTPGADPGFNPDPPPPDAGGAGPGVDATDVGKYGFNPQPDPPVVDTDVHGFNPQPEPPADDAMGIDPSPFAEADDAMGISPQPFQADEVVGDEQHR